MILWGGEAMHEALAAWRGGAGAVEAEDRCVNEGAKRADGSWCRARAKANGWCEACWAEIGPA